MSRVKLFIENFLSFGFIQIVNKIIPFIFLPIIARLLPNASDFGVFDMYYVLLSFGCGIACLSLPSAFFREYFEKDDIEYKNTVARTSRYLTLISSSIFCVLVLIFHRFIAGTFLAGTEYSYVIILCAIAIFIETNMGMVQLPMRILNQRKLILKRGILNALSQKIIAIALILLGYTYFGLIYANIITSLIFLLYFSRHYRDFFRFGHFDKALAKSMLKYSIPLIPVSIIFWVNHSVDRIMISKFLDLTQLGIFGIGSRVASLGKFVQLAFGTGWTYFAFSTMRDRDRKTMTGNLWSLMFCICTSFYLIIFLFKDLIFNLLFTGDYIQGVTVFPYLMLAPLLIIFTFIIEGQFQIIKKTFYSPIIMSVGCGVNIVMNYLLIHPYGIVGAAIATLSGYFVTVLVEIIVVVMWKRLVIFPKKTYLMVAVFIGVFIFINLPAGTPPTSSGDVPIATALSSLEENYGDAVFTSTLWERATSSIHLRTILAILGYLSLMVWMWGKKIMEYYQQVRGKR